MVSVLLEDASVLAVNKPPGVSVVFDRHRPEEKSLWREVWQLYGPVFVVHRLDRDTTGVLLFARNAAAQKNLSQAFSQHRVQKLYHAIVAGVPPWREMTVEHPLREDGDRAHRTVVDWEGGKPAVTHVRVLAVLRGGNALVEASLVTGRRHQVRAHLQALGYPLVGDTLYGGSSSAVRPLLHARLLVFPHPVGGTFVQVYAPYPEDWKGFLEKWEKS